MTKLLSRDEFRERCLERDSNKCLIPNCDSDADEVHHIIERKLWSDGGYYLRNGASVCNEHHQYAEKNYIPPQAFWYWLEVEPLTPDGLPKNINKWGVTFDTPPWKEWRERIKYPSTGHLPFSPEWDGNRVDWGSVESLLDVPLVVTIKMDGGNAMITKDAENPVRARNGKHAEHQSFDQLKKIYWDENVHEKIPETFQVFGEWLYAKHSIHYGCDCKEKCDDTAPPLDSYFQVFGIYDYEYDIWLSWSETVRWSNLLGFRTVPVVERTIQFERDDQLYEELLETAKGKISEGHEGIVVRPVFPFHYSQFENSVAKYVREGHVQPGEKHWKHRQVKKNVLKG